MHVFDGNVDVDVDSPLFRARKPRVLRRSHRFSAWVHGERQPPCTNRHHIHAILHTHNCNDYNTTENSKRAIVLFLPYRSLHDTSMASARRTKCSHILRRDVAHGHLALFPVDAAAAALASSTVNAAAYATARSMNYCAFMMLWTNLA